MAESPAKRGSSWLSSIKEAFVEETPEIPKAPPPYVPSPSTLPQPHHPSAAPWATRESSPPVVDVDQAMLANLTQKINAGLSPEYMAFSEQYEHLKEFIPDEGKLFQAALKASKVDIAQVRSALLSMSTVLEHSRTSFEKMAVTEEQAAQMSYEAEQARLEKAAQDAKAEIARLQDYVGQNHLDRQETTAQYERTKRKHELLRAKFMTTYGHVANNIHRQQSKIPQG